MNSNLPEQQPSEEVDLGQLFKLIGNAFDRFFRFIGKIFKGLFFLLIDLLVFIQGHIKKLALVAVLGLLTGMYFDVKKPPLYESHMVVEPNFYSTSQLYTNIHSLNNFIKSRDSVSLSKALNISLNEAASISVIHIGSAVYGNEQVALYDEFIKELDTASRKYVNFQTYKSGFTSFDSRFHDVAIVSEDAEVATKTQKAIVESVDDKEYFILQKELNDKNIELREKFNTMQVNEIDSIQRNIRDVMRKTAEQPNAGTNINLAESSRNSGNTELSLIKQLEIIKGKQVLLNADRGRTSKIINIISDFPKRGVRVRGFFKSNKFLFFCLFVGSMFGILILLELNKYLKQYKFDKQSG